MHCSRMKAGWQWSLGLVLAAGLASGTARAQAPAPKQAAASEPLVLRGVTVIDVRDGRRLADQQVTIVGNRIEAVAPAAGARAPQGAHLVDAKGKYVIPGLWDMHTHIFGTADIAYPLFVANGVTGIREMSQQRPAGPDPLGIDSMLQWRREIQAGSRVGPRIVGTGFSLFTPLPDSISWVEQGFLKTAEGQEIVVQTPEQGRALVDSLKAAGADFVKMHDGNDRAIYFAIAAEARRVGLPLVGHIGRAFFQPGVSAIEASDSGVRSVEHLEELLCLVAAKPTPPDTLTLLQDIVEREGYVAFRAADAVARTRCGEVAARFQKNGTWFTPTLTAYNQLLNDDVTARRGYAPEGAWHADKSPIFDRFYMPAARLLHEVGMPFLAGTDVTPGGAPGFLLHDELALLVQAGLTPLEALQTATLNPAKFFRATDTLGTVEAGKVADLVVLDADPLADIHRTTAIAGVVANGRYFDRAALDALLAGAKAAAAR